MPVARGVFASACACFFPLPRLSPTLPGCVWCAAVDARPTLLADIPDGPGRNGPPHRLPAAGSQVMLEILKIARHIAVDERDADSRVDGKPAVVRGEHVGSRLGIEEAPSLDSPQVRRLTFRPFR